MGPGGRPGQRGFRRLGEAGLDGKAQGGWNPDVTGGSTWVTSVFPDSTRGAHVLPVKKAIRRAESLDAGDVATVTVETVDL